MSSMFQDEEVPEGVTLRVYRFETRRPVMSIVIRMLGDKIDKAKPYVASFREDIIEYKQKDADRYEEEHPSTFWQRRTEDQEAELTRLRNVAKAEPFLDMPVDFAEDALADLREQLEQNGFKLKKRERRSNGDLDEEILHYV